MFGINFFSYSYLISDIERSVIGPWPMVVLNPKQGHPLSFTRLYWKKQHWQKNKRKRNKNFTKNRRRGFLRVYLDWITETLLCTDDAFRGMRCPIDYFYFPNSIGYSSKEFEMRLVCRVFDEFLVRILYYLLCFTLGCCCVFAEKVFKQNLFHTCSGFGYCWVRDILLHHFFRL